MDISQSRLAIARSMVKKYRLYRARLFHADGQTFDELAPPPLDQLLTWRKQMKTKKHDEQEQQEQEHIRLKRPFHADRFLSNLSSNGPAQQLYDKV